MTCCRTRNEDMPQNWDVGIQPIPQGDEWSEARKTAKELLKLAKIICGISSNKPYAKIRDLHGVWMIKDGLTTRDPEEASVFTRKEVKEFLRFRIPQNYLIFGVRGEEWDGRTELSF